MRMFTFGLQSYNFFLILPNHLPIFFCFSGEMTLFFRKRSVRNVLLQVKWGQ